MKSSIGNLPRCLLLAVAIALCGPAWAVSDVQAKLANEQAERMTDTAEYLATIDHKVALARSGEYGVLRRGSDKTLQAARDRIAGLLAGHASGHELPLEDRLAIYSAQEEIDSIIRSDDKNRMVCRQVATIGTRFATKECRTVGEREERARAGMEATDNLQRVRCFPTVDNPCGH